MPFHVRLLGKDRMALFSFIHSLNTNFGTSIFEPIFAFIGKQRFKKIETQASAGEYITDYAQSCIQEIMDDLLCANKMPNTSEEIELLRSVCRKGKKKQIKTTKIDIKLISYDERVYFIDLKTAKPNKGSFKEFKRTFLEWIASFLYLNPNAQIYTVIGIPYNPYYPKPYARWRRAGLFDAKNELKVGEELWDFVGGEGTYNDLLEIFEAAGKKLCKKIDIYFNKH